jgi:FMN phosphatase YigB (HAD superfamily)
LSGLIPDLDWSAFKAVIFDVDGTLYDQKKLRLIMARELALYCLTHPHRLWKVRILSTFRRLREEQCDCEEPCLIDAQYRWTSEALNCDQTVVQQVVEEWILRRPLPHLISCRPNGLAELFNRLRTKGIKIGVFSDYPAAEKLHALELKADQIATAVDPHINRFKPGPNGVRHLLNQFKINPNECLHIGDRDDRDGLCAERSRCASLILSAHKAKNAGPAQSYDLLFPQ